MVSSSIFKVFGMTRPGIEPRSPGPLANTLTAGPMNGHEGAVHILQSPRTRASLSYGLLCVLVQLSVCCLSSITFHIFFISVLLSQSFNRSIDRWKDFNPFIFTYPNLFLPIYVSIRRCPWCSRYRLRKWTRRHEFKSWTRLIAFHIALIP